MLSSKRSIQLVLHVPNCLRGHTSCFEMQWNKGLFLNGEVFGIPPGRGQATLPHECFPASSGPGQSFCCVCSLEISGHIFKLHRNDSQSGTAKIKMASLASWQTATSQLQAVLG